MSTISNLDSQGGRGTKYEFDVDTAFMIQFLIGGTVPGLDSSQIEMLRFQSSSLGYETDDLLLHCLDATGETRRILVQVKISLNMSERNPMFQETLHKAWQDFTNKDLFDPLLDRIYLITNDLKTDEKKHLKTLCNWAKVKYAAADFLNEAERIIAKKKYLDLFRTVLSSGKGAKLTDDELFSFFKCFDVLEYDFDEAASTAKNSFLTVIEHAKAENCALKAFQIWNEVFAFVSHADSKGGSFSQANFPSQLTSYFRAAYYPSIQNRLVQISKGNWEILQSIPDLIGNVSIPRTSYQERLINEITDNSIAIITGEPGTGKSIVARHFLETIQKVQGGFILVFRADELGKMNLRDFFHQVGIHLSIVEIFQSFPLHANHLIYIDALEKLTENEGVAFRQLLQAIKPFPNIKLISTCRQTEFPLIRYKYFLDYSFHPIEVAELNDDELRDVSRLLPDLVPVMQNRRLVPLLRFPKYLDFAYRAIQSSTVSFKEIDERQFKQRLWDVIVENKLTADKDGLPIRRRNLFIQIAVGRAKEMTPYVFLSPDDPQALLELEKDGVIVKSELQVDSFAPSHDILEDWALVRHAEKIYQANPSPTTFFAALGEEPAMRRAYRLWTQQVLQYGSALQRSFFSTVLQDDTLSSFWADESLIALLYSAYLETFLQSNRALLQQDDWVLFVKLVHIMRTACREKGELTDTKEKKFLPIGNCWQQIFRFSLDSISSLSSKHYDLLLQTVEDWHFILYSKNIHASDTVAPGNIINWLLDNHYSHTPSYKDQGKIKLCLQLLFDCSGGVPQKIGELLSGTINSKSDDYEVRGEKKSELNEKIVKLSLTGFATTQLAKYTGEQILQLLQQEWIRKPPVVRRNSLSKLGIPIYTGSRTDSNIAFGLMSEYRRDYFPSSAFQTPVYWLLKLHTKPTLAFVIELLNYATAKYVASDWATSDKKEIIILHLPDGKTAEQQGSVGLWCMFRGTGIATPPLLQSVLMALEKFLLEMAAEEQEKKELFQELIGELYLQSKTVALTAVIASVAQAYPAMMGKWVVPLFSHRRMLYWDISRLHEDYNPTNLFPYHGDRVFWQERDFSNKLPHRLKYEPGLRSFIVDYCLLVKDYNAEIFALLDKLMNEAKPDDWEWKKILAEMDIRNWKVIDEKKINGKILFQLAPVHKGKLKKQVEKMQAGAKQFADDNEKIAWLMQVNDKKKEADIVKWREIVASYKNLKEFNPVQHYPGIAAHIGIQYLWDELETDEMQWCYDEVMSIASTQIRHEATYDFTRLSMSPFDGEAAMVALVLLLDKKEVEADSHMKFLIDVLFFNANYNSIWFNKFLDSLADIAWKTQPERALQLWKAIVLYAKLEKINPAIHRRYRTEKEIEKYQKKEAAFRLQIRRNKQKINFAGLKLSTHSQWSWRKAIRMLPTKNCPAIGEQFLMHLVDLYIHEQVQGKLVRSYQGNEEEEDRFNPHLKIELEKKLAEVILWNAPSSGKVVFKELLSRYFPPQLMEAEAKSSERGNTSLLKIVLEKLITTTDQNLPENDLEREQQITFCFQTIWREYLNLCLAQNQILYGDLLMLRIHWKEDADHWIPLDGMETFYKNVVLMLGNQFIPAVVNLLSHIGDKTLLATCFPILWKHLQKSEKPLLSIPHITQLISRGYHHHYDTLRENQSLRQNYLQLLDAMVQEGSSDAYWIRENIISIRQKV